MNNFDYYIKNFFSLNNPVIYSIMFSFLLIGMTVFIFIKIIYPMRKKFYEEKENLLFEQTKLMALFSELDPDPSLRCDSNGIITLTNEASRKLFFDIDLIGRPIKDIIKNFNGSIEELIAKDEGYSFLENIHGKIFLVNVRGNKNFNFAHLYLNDITQMKEYENELELYKEKLKILADELENRFDVQRNQLSSELHDDIGQKMVLLKLKIGQLNVENKEIITGDIDEIYSRIREISHSIKPLEIDELGLRHSIQMLVYKVEETTGLKGQFSYLGPDEKIDSDVEICFYRVAQEAIANILKHSNANEFSVQFINSNDKWELFISDDGIGIPGDYFLSENMKRFGIGLFSIQERLNSFKGTLKINSELNEGTNIIAKIPKM